MGMSKWGWKTLTCVSSHDAQILHPNLFNILHPGWLLVSLPLCLDSQKQKWKMASPWLPRNQLHCLNFEVPNVSSMLKDVTAVPPTYCAASFRPAGFPTHSQASAVAQAAIPAFEKFFGYRQVSRPSQPWGSHVPSHRHLSTLGQNHLKKLGSKSSH